MTSSARSPTSSTRWPPRLQASYAGLEHQVQERTRELASALAELDEKTRELEAASHHKSEFLANMSHELRTPLNAIIGFSAGAAQAAVRRDQRQAGRVPRRHPRPRRHLLSLIDDVLDLSKVEAGQIELQVAPFSLPETLERGVVIVRERATQGTASRSRWRRIRASRPSSATSAGSGRWCSICSRTRSSSRRPVARSTSRPRGVRRRGPRVGQRHRARHRAGGPGSASSRSSSRPTRARSSARGRASGWRCRSASSSCTAGGSGSTASSGKGSTFVFTLPGADRVAMAGEQILVVEDNDEEHEAASRRASGDRLSHAGGIDRRTGAGAGDRAWTGARADGHPAAGHGRRWRRCAGCGRTSGRHRSRCSP